MAGTVPFLRQALWHVFSLQSWSRPGAVLPVLTVHHVVLSSHKFARQPITMLLNVTHDEVLGCIAAAAFQKLHSGDACGIDCGAAASFKIFISLFRLCVM